jgi:hypothetical protein
VPEAAAAARELTILESLADQAVAEGEAMALVAQVTHHQLLRRKAIQAAPAIPMRLFIPMAAVAAGLER